MGATRVQFYNDAYVGIAQDRHPELLGRSVAEGWPDAYDEVIAPLLNAIDAGQTTRLTGFSIALRGHDGRQEERTFDTDWMPVRDASGAIAGALQTLTEVTDHRRTEMALSVREKQQTFLLALSDGLRSIGDAAVIRRTACALLGKHLRVARTYYVDYEAEHGYGVVADDHTEPGLPSLAGRYPYKAFRTTFERIGTGITWVVPDVTSERELPDAERDFYAEQGVISWVNVPLLKDGTFRAAFCIVAKEPRNWLAYEVGLIEDVADRLWAAIERVRAEVALRASEAQLAAAFESVPVGAAVIDLDGKAVFANAEYRRFLPTGLIPSRDPARLTQWRAWDGSGKLLAPFEFPGARALRGESVVPGQEMLFTNDEGREIWTRVATAPTFDGDGRVTGVVTTISDIDRAKRDGEALRQSEERLRGFGEASTDVLWIRDAETLAWTYLTPAFETIYGMSREEALGRDDFHTWLDLILPEDRERAYSIISRVREGERVTFEYRIKRPIDGAISWLRNTDFPIRDAKGKVYAIGGVGHDVTAEKEADRTIRASRRQLRTLVEGMAQLVWRAVACGDWTWASPQWTTYTGQSSEASTGRGWLAVVHPDDVERAVDAWSWTAETEEPLDVEYRIRQASNGTYRWFQTRALPVRNEETGEIIEWLGTSTDIDDLRELQDSQAVMVTELQHRTRNLIAVVSSIARQTMAETGPTEAFRMAFKERMEALSRVQGLLSQAGDERVTVREVLETEFAAHGADRLSGKVWLDGPDVPLRKSIVQTLALALHELVTNACKYGALTGEGGNLLVRWTTSRAENEERRLFLEWIESGIAIAMDGGEAVTQGGGYGRKLIEKSLPYTLRARTTYELRSDGLHCTIDLPLTKQTVKEQRT